MDHLVQALRAAYADAWQDIISGAILFDLLYFAVGALFYFVLYERRTRRVRLHQLPRYIVDPHLLHSTAPVEHTRQSARIDRQSWLLRFLWAPPLTALTTALALVFGVFLSGKLDAWLGGQSEKMEKPAK